MKNKWRDIAFILAEALKTKDAIKGDGQAICLTEITEEEANDEIEEEKTGMKAIKNKFAKLFNNGKD